MANVPFRIQELVETFGRNIEAYRSQQYKETQLRREFIDPLFEELGWDVANKNGYAEAYKDVVHEDAIKVGGATKAPDYCFRIGGVRKFFLEAKKPSVDIKADPHPAYQLRRYAWSAKLPLSILTDFEEFAVYDCQNRPRRTDRSSTGSRPSSRLRSLCVCRHSADTVFAIAVRTLYSRCCQPSQDMLFSNPATSWKSVVG